MQNSSANEMISLDNYPASGVNFQSWPTWCRLWNIEMISKEAFQILFGGGDVPLWRTKSAKQYLRGSLKEGFEEKNIKEMTLASLLKNMFKLVGYWGFGKTAGTP